MHLWQPLWPNCNHICFHSNILQVTSFSSKNCLVFFFIIILYLVFSFAPKNVQFSSRCYPVYECCRVIFEKWITNKHNDNINSFIFGFEKRCIFFSLSFQSVKLFMNYNENSHAMSFVSRKLKRKNCCIERNKSTVLFECIKESNKNKIQTKN